MWLHLYYVFPQLPPSKNTQIISNHHYHPPITHLNLLPCQLPSLLRGSLHPIPFGPLSSPFPLAGSCHHFSNHTPETIHLHSSHHSLRKLASVSTTHSTEAHSGFLRKGSILISFVAYQWLFLETPAPALGAQECLLLLSLLLSLLPVLDGLDSLICCSS